MQRWDCATIVLVGVVLAAGFTTACSEDDTKPPVIEKSTLPPTEPIEPPASGPTADQAARSEQIIRELMIWPSNGTAPRDVMVDYRECLAKMNESPKLRSVNALAQLSWMTGCMTDRGWQVNPEAGVQSDQP